MGGNNMNSCEKCGMVAQQDDAYCRRCRAVLSNSGTIDASSIQSQNMFASEFD